jgi:hypothetical protein
LQSKLKELEESKKIKFQKSLPKFLKQKCWFDDDDGSSPNIRVLSAREDIEADSTILPIYGLYVYVNELEVSYIYI